MRLHPPYFRIFVGWVERNIPIVALGRSLADLNQARLESSGATIFSCASLEAEKADKRHLQVDHVSAPARLDRLTPNVTAAARQRLG